MGWLLIRRHRRSGAVQLPVMVEHLTNFRRRFTQRIAQVLSVGKYELEILAHGNGTGPSRYGAVGGQVRIAGWD